MARNRFWAADNIWNGGACNPRGIARALVEAFDQAAEEGGGTDAACNDAAARMILDHLCFLCHLPQPSLTMGVGPDTEWGKIEAEVNRRKGETLA
jgi:cytochrome c5